LGSGAGNRFLAPKGHPDSCEMRLIGSLNVDVAFGNANEASSILSHVWSSREEERYRSDVIPGRPLPSGRHKQEPDMNWGPQSDIMRLGRLPEATRVKKKAKQAAASPSDMRASVSSIAAVRRDPGPDENGIGRLSLRTSAADPVPAPEAKNETGPTKRGRNQVRGFKTIRSEADTTGQCGKREKSHCIMGYPNHFSILSALRLFGKGLLAVCAGGSGGLPQSDIRFSAQSHRIGGQLVTYSAPSGRHFVGGLNFFSLLPSQEQNLTAGARVDRRAGLCLSDGEPIGRRLRDTQPSTNNDSTELGRGEEAVVSLYDVTASPAELAHRC